MSGLNISNNVMYIRRQIISLLERITDYANKNGDKRIAMFVDMDGVIVSLDIDISNNIGLNKPFYFFNKKPLKSVINMLSKVSKIPNIDLYILSACGYKNQADDKIKWLEKHAPFFTKENQIYVIKEDVKYTRETKPKIKTQNIIDTMNNKGYDLVIYFEDELFMLKEAYNLLKEKILLLHISDFID